MEDLKEYILNDDMEIEKEDHTFPFGVFYKCIKSENYYKIICDNIR